MRPTPKTPHEWLTEIAAAYQDAHETLPFMPLADAEPNETELFHLAPHVAIKFRGLPRSRTKAAVEAALSSYVATKEQVPDVFDDPYLPFAFCYLASHFGLGLLRHEDVDEAMTFIERNQTDLGKAIDRLIGPACEQLQ
jgi:hypothetical protein